MKTFFVASLLVFFIPCISMEEADTERIVALQKETQPIQGELQKFKYCIARLKSPLSKENKENFQCRAGMIKQYLSKVWIQLNRVHTDVNEKEIHFSIARAHLDSAKKELVEYKTIFKEKTQVDIDQEPEPQLQAKL